MLIKRIKQIRKSISCYPLLKKKVRFIHQLVAKRKQLMKQTLALNIRKDTLGNQNSTGFFFGGAVAGLVLNPALYVMNNEKSLELFGDSIEYWCHHHPTLPILILGAYIIWPIFTGSLCGSFIDNQHESIVLHIDYDLKNIQKEIKLVEGKILSRRPVPRHKIESLIANRLNFILTEEEYNKNLYELRSQHLENVVP